MDGCHFLAFFSTALARIRAALAVLRFVFAAFIATSAADFGANAANFAGEFRAAGHERRRRVADFRAIMVKQDTARHHRDVTLLQTGAGAVFALGGAFVASFNAVSVFLVHTFPFVVVLLCLGCAFGLVA